MTKIDYIYDFEGYSGPEPFACELILPARKYGKNKAVKHPELTTVCTCTKCQAMPSIERVDVVKPMLEVWPFSNQPKELDLMLKKSIHRTKLLSSEIK